MPISCKKGGVVTIRHNEIRNITAQLAKEICGDVQIEPQLQQLSEEKFEPQTRQKCGDACLDI